jgi:hypothetical protein
MQLVLPRGATAAMIATAMAAAAQAQQQTVVPAAFSDLDAVRHLPVAGIGGPMRVQTLVGPSHLAGLLGHAITAFELRRSADGEAYPAGAAQVTVTMSTSPRSPLQTSTTFASHVGADAVQVFAGVLHAPASPAEPGPQVAWDSDNTVRVDLQTPFVYTGGTLCVDVVGAPITGAVWWLADAESLASQTRATSVGSGCGAYGGANGEWSAAVGFVAGGHTQFFANGTPGGVALAAFGTLGAAPVPLTALGLPASMLAGPGCALHLGSLHVVLPAVFTPMPEPEEQPFGGEAWLDVWVPDDPALCGASLSAQWFDLAQVAASNATRGVIAATLPSLDMATVYGHPLDAEGLAAAHTAHVLRFEHQ